MNSTALYGIAAFADGYAVFWNGRYDETRYATREAAISELAKRDRAETFINGVQPTPCQQQQGNRVNAPQYKKPAAPCRCSRLPFPHRRAIQCAQHDDDLFDGTDYAREDAIERRILDRDAATACNEIRNRG
jgi:hypothetical protein